MEIDTSRIELSKGDPAVTTTGAVSVDRGEWERAMSSFRSIAAEDAEFTPNWWKAYNDCKQECERIPHTTLRPDPHTGRRNPITTADEQFVKYARKTVADVAAGRTHFDDLPGLQEHLQLCRDVAEAANERDAQVQAVRDHYDMDALDEKAEALGDSLSDAQSVVMSTPAPDLAALRWKLDHISDGGTSWDSWSDEYVSQLNSDIARLLPSGG